MPLGTVSALQILPPSFDDKINPVAAPATWPTATQSDALAHDTPLSTPVPLGTVAAFHAGTLAPIVNTTPPTSVDEYPPPTHVVAPEQARPATIATPVGSAMETQVWPLSVEVCKSPEPPATQRLPDTTHDTASRVPVPVGTVPGVHAWPPFVEYSVTAALVAFKPTATQTVDELHETEPRDSAKLETEAALQLTPPSVVYRATALVGGLEPLSPTTTQSETVEQDAP